MRLALLNMPIITQKADRFQIESLHPRIGVCSIGTQAKHAGHEVIILDPELDKPETILGKLTDFKPRFVGIAAYTEEIIAADKTAELIKSHIPGTQVIVGGHHASALPLRTLSEFPNIDMIIAGEGEQTMLELLAGNKIGDIPGVGWRNSGQICFNRVAPKIDDINRLAPPDWNLFNIERYRGSSLATGFKHRGNSLDISVEGARGCPFNCHFCFRMSGKEIRYKKPQRIVDEIIRDIELYGATSIYFTEGSYGVNRQHAIETCKLMIEQRLGERIRWTVGGRINLLDEELLELMYKSGCRFLGIGVESGSQEILDRIGKNISIKRIEEVFNYCRQLGIETEANFIIGHPFETEETVNQTIEFARRLRADNANFAILVPFPGTLTAQYAKEGYGGLRIKSENWALYGKQIGAAMELDQLPTDKLIKLQNKAYRRFYLRPRNLPKFIRKLNTGRMISILKRLLNQ